ncbi:hypothetical protein fugu_015482, partial [Takifugu bimaculatus]
RRELCSPSVNAAVVTTATNLATSRSHMNCAASKPIANTHIIPIPSTHTLVPDHIQALGQGQDTPGTGGGPKDCYSHQGYPGYGSGNGSGNGSSTSSQAKKTYTGSKVPTPHPSQHLPGPGGYGNHMGPGNYSAQYLSEGHLQQKWEDPAQIAQYDQEMLYYNTTGPIHERAFLGEALVKSQFVESKRTHLSGGEHIK